MRVTLKETFGPVMSVLIFDDDQAIIERANNTEFGLSTSVMTADLSHAHRMADRLMSGNVWVNSFNILLPSLPFGGATHSDLGRENSINTLDAYSEVKSVHITL